MQWNRQLARFSALTKLLHGHCAPAEMVDRDFRAHPVNTFCHRIRNRSRQILTAKEKPAAEIHRCDFAVQSGVLQEHHDARFMRWFDLMGVQRHLKAAGIFARLHVRDGKPGYLGDIPRTLGYILNLEPVYPELEGLYGLVRLTIPG